ncbi:MAG: phosphotransferase family protein [Acidobacteria bacterium]|nr:phosphotransferase family protein [Acidobacteriota bacterium]
MKEIDNIRKGEELNVDRLGEYIRNRMPTPFSTIELFQFTAGSSNLTYLIRLGGHEYVLRRPPFGNTVKTAHDMKREYDVLTRLAMIYDPAPEPVLFCDDETVIGSSFYLMERKRGVTIRGEISDDDLSPDSGHTAAQIDGLKRARTKLNGSPEFRLAVIKAFVENLSRLHAVNYEFAGLGGLGKPEGYPKRQVEGWSQRYMAARTHDLPQLEAVIRWLNENIPAETGAALIHNDYKFDNVMFSPIDLTRIVGVLDWEMVTIGDPLMDLGTTLGYWMSPDAGEEMLSMHFNPRVLMENISRRELADLYGKASGRDVSDILFYYVFGTFKVAVIAQQIFARYVKGSTKDERFAKFDRFVAALGSIAHHALEKQTI